MLNIGYFMCIIRSSMLNSNKFMLNIINYKLILSSSMFILGSSLLNGHKPAGLPLSTKESNTTYLFELAAAGSEN